MQTLENKQIWIVAVVALILGFLFDYLFWQKGLGISFFVYSGLLLGALYGLLHWFKFAFNKKTLWLVAPALFFSGMVAVRDSEFLLFWNLVLTLGLLLVIANYNLGKSITDYIVVDYFKAAFILPLKFLKEFFSSLGELFAIRKIVKENQKAEQVVKGILITIPVLIFFVILLSSADLVFGKIFSNLIDFEINLESLARPWWIFVFAFIWLGVLTYILKNLKANAEFAQEKVSNFQLGKIEAGILFGAVNLLFLVFVVIQFKYLFAGESAITRLGFTYAEYARKGFFELIAAAVFSLIMVFGVEKYVQKAQGAHLKMFKFLSAFLIALVIIMMLSAFLRLGLYENAYGFTEMRFMSQAFIVWLGVVFLFLLYKIFSFSKEQQFLFNVFCSVLVFFAILNIINPEAVIARKNIEQFAKNGKLDSNYLSILSTDAVPEIAKLLDMKEYKDKKGIPLSIVAANLLKSKKRGLDLYKKTWQSYNVSRNRAIELINRKLP